MSIEIRDECEEDFSTIYQIVEAAFKDRSYADGDEQDLVNALRKQGGLAVSLVAVDGGELVGHIAFSLAGTFGDNRDKDGNWYTLGPVAVRPDKQTEGIGGLLINEGLDRLVKAGAAGCILTGNPVYYRRFGFEFSPTNVPEGVASEHFLVKSLGASLPDGPFSFHPAFGS